MRFEKEKKSRAYELGQSGEAIALSYLKKIKYRILEKGFRFLRGEIDLIALDGRTLVFVEVKTREKSLFGLPEESVTPTKRRQIKRIAQGYLLKHPRPEVECRFDVLAITFDMDGKHLIRHLKNAF
ncbi:MAG: YraN family protein [Candidatus Aminicenantes bacterium]|nr:YraN family protein [Candidatus Aminicenantes bacterium]